MSPANQSPPYRQYHAGSLIWAEMTGILTVNVEPAPSLLSAEICAPCCSASARAIERTQPGTAGLTGANLVRAPEPIEDMRELLRANADARVAHGQNGGTIFRRQVDRYGTVGGVYLLALSMRIRQSWRREASSPMT